jgi:arylsulfatase A-like enzyme
VLLFTAVLTVVPATSTGAGTLFTDVNDESALAAALSWALEEDVVTGFSDGSFRPGTSVTRGQAVTWMWNEEDQPARSDPNPFTDLRPGGFAYAAADWAGESGIVGGYPDHTFRPGRMVTRGQLVTWLWRLVGGPEPAGPTPFTDIRDGSQLGKATAWASEQHVAAGYADGRFRPSLPVTRGTAVQWQFATADPPPNVLMVLTDDQTLASLAVMPQTQALVGDRGTTFLEDISAFPLCCPARATHATGQYSHNHGVVDNDNEPHPSGTPSGPVIGQGGYDVFDHTNTVATWMDAAGYETSYVGKTLNDYNGATAMPPAPPGYDHWYGWILQAPTQQQPDLQSYFNYEIYEDPDGAAGPQPGAEVLYGNTDEDYLTDVLRDRALAQMDLLRSSGDPWFLTFAPFAPHTGTGRTRQPVTNGVATPPAPRDVDTFGQLTDPPNWPLQDNPAYDTIPDGAAPWVQDARDSPASGWNLLKANGTRNDTSDDLTDQQVQDLVDSGYQQYIESLFAVDDAVAALVNHLPPYELRRTIVIFTSDNGYAWGEHGFVSEKNEPYEESLRVPLLIRGPGFPAGVTVDAPTADIDYAPTLVRASGATPGLVMDGLALQDIAARPEDYGDRAILINDWPTSTRPLNRIRHWEGIRTTRYTYLEVPETSSVELYDRSVDPHQLTSVAADPAYAAVVTYFDGLLTQMLGCTGAACDVRAHPPEPTP